MKKLVSKTKLFRRKSESAQALALYGSPDAESIFPVSPKSGRINEKVQKIKPKSGFAHAFHIVLLCLLPILVYVFVQLNFANVALAIILLSKWRMLAVRPRHWPANIRANAIDIIVGISILIFMSLSITTVWQAIWAVVYGVWLVGIKPGSSTTHVSAQAGIGQVVGLMALYLAWPDASIWALVVGSWVVTYAAARHFFSSFDEPHASLYAHFWGYFAAALAWLSGHWLLFYADVAQPVVLLTVIGTSLAALYYLDQTDRLSILVRRQFMFIVVVVVAVVLLLSDWSGRII